MAHIKLEFGLLCCGEFGIGDGVGEFVGSMIVAIAAKLVYANILCHACASPCRGIAEALVSSDKQLSSMMLQIEQWEFEACRWIHLRFWGALQSLVNIWTLQPNHACLACGLWQNRVHTLIWLGLPRYSLIDSSQSLRWSEHWFAIKATSERLHFVAESTHKEPV